MYLFTIVIFENVDNIFARQTSHTKDHNHGMALSNKAYLILDSLNLRRTNQKRCYQNSIICF